jgi:hypothetical protein
MSEMTIDVTTAESVTEPTDAQDTVVASGQAPGEESGVSALDVQMLRRLADQARDQGLELTGVDEMVLSLSARGLTHGEISAHLAGV